MKLFGKIFFAVAIAAVILTPAAFAQSTATANATATIVPAMTIAQVTDLAFGDMLGTVGGTVTVDPAGGRTSVNVVLAGGIPSAATFDLTGVAGKAFSVTLPAPFNISNGTDLMLVSAFTSTSAPAGVLDASGESLLSVGAMLTVGANQPLGLYQGTFDVGVAYN